MFVIVMGNLVGALAQILDTVILTYIWVVIISIALSWVNADPYNPIVRFLRRVTEPVLYRIRRYIPVLGGIDFSPFVLILILYFLDMFAVKTLSDLAYRLH